ncbi:hypothetical protein I4U23_002787 [Adineta vaga]|nr:hypothetical protein I4U23_002787 [Adineta vaga]
MISESERIHHLEWRIKRLENFIGNSSKTRISEIVNNLNEQVIEYASNNSLTARKLVYNVDQINRLINPNFQRYIIGDRLINYDLILADEIRIRAITRNFTEIETLAQVLKGECFQEMPKLFATLNKLLTIHENTKNEHGVFMKELSSFLQDYAEFTLLMDENLQQYKSIVNKDHQLVPNNPNE